MTRNHFNRKKAFTLLELVIAVTLLAGFVLPVLQILAQSRVRAVRYTQLRTVKSLAQKRLHDHIHHVEEIQEFDGTFEEDGYPSWTWQINPPELRAQSEQIVLEYTIRVWVPLPQLGASKGGGNASDMGSDGGSRSRGGVSSSGSIDEGSTYEYSVWTIPSPRWMDDQAELFYSDQPSLLYGDPSFDGHGDFYPGAGGAAGMGAPR